MREWSEIVAPIPVLLLLDVYVFTMQTRDERGLLTADELMRGWRRWLDSDRRVRQDPDPLQGERMPLAELAQKAKDLVREVFERPDAPQSASGLVPIQQTLAAAAKPSALGRPDQICPSCGLGYQAERGECPRCAMKRQLEEIKQ